MRPILLGAVLATVAGSLYGLSACSKAPALPTLPNSIPKVQPRVQVVSITTPGVRIEGGALVVSARNLSIEVNTADLRDVDQGFARVGVDPDQSRDLTILSAAVRGLFSMGYFDMLNPLSQRQVDDLMENVEFTKPIAIEAPGARGKIWVVCAIEGQDLLGAVRLVEDPNGISVVDVVHATANSGLALLLDSFPALGRDAADRALSSFQPIGLSVQVAEPSSPERVVLPNVRGMAGPLCFFWLRGSDSSGTTVSSDGRVFHFSLPCSVQDLGSEGQSGPPISLTQIGRVGVLESEREALER